MHPINSVLVARMLPNTAAAASSVDGFQSEGGMPFGTLWRFIYAGCSCFFVLFAGMMSRFFNAAALPLRKNKLLLFFLWFKNSINFW
ncbi:hypothetical protein HRI_000095600 [Hibiscus trionum]|uniref:Uncharacterized protein n=1 Tax=Hibiscus trionum TaxID=183268 RepID=A0A9W7LGM8_HIBTR|nr:hypothetical protein HRI_000095600 [Hibiscus trionum]